MSNQDSPRQTTPLATEGPPAMPPTSEPELATLPTSTHVTAIAATDAPQKKKGVEPPKPCLVRKFLDRMSGFTRCLCTSNAPQRANHKASHETPIGYFAGPDSSGRMDQMDWSLYLEFDQAWRHEDQLINHRVTWPLQLSDGGFVVLAAAITFSASFHTPLATFFSAAVACMISIPALFGTWSTKKSLGAAATQIKYCHRQLAFTFKNFPWHPKDAVH